MRRFRLIPAVLFTVVALYAQRDFKFNLSGPTESTPPSRVLTRKALANLRASAAANPTLAHARMLLNHRRHLSMNASSIFLEAPTYTSGGFNAASIVIADVNGDRKPDLLIANQCDSLPSCSTGVVAVMLGNGDGTFQAPQTYSTGGFAAAVAVADVNKDGKLDLVVANSFSNTVGVLLGNGDGTFQAVQTFGSGGSSAVSIAVADVNRDGNPDILVANGCFSDFDCSTGAAAVLLGNGDGTFQTATPYASGGFGGSTSIAVADVNADGKPDLLVSNFCASGSSGNGCTNNAGSVGVLLGNGDGTFQPAVTYASGGMLAEWLTVADVNGDGKPDLLVANNCASLSSPVCTGGGVGVLLGNGDGTFQSALTQALNGPFAFSIAVSDVNGDGKPDLVVSSRGIQILLGHGDGTFQAPKSYSATGYNTFSVAVTDISGDGVPDVVAVNNCAGPVCDSDSQFQVFLGEGHGQFRAAPAYDTRAFVTSAVISADVNGDGKADLLMANQCANSLCAHGSVGVRLGKGDGTFQPPRLNASRNLLYSIATADVNGDGKLDLLVAGADPNTSAGSVGVLLGNGDGTFQAIHNYSSGGFFAFSVAVADVNGDGKPDLIVANNCGDILNCFSDQDNGSIGVLLGNGDGTFQAAQTYFSGGFYATSVTVADVNGDRKPDLVVANRCLTTSPGCFVTPPALGAIAVLLGNGDGTFQTPQSYSSGGYEALSVAVGDLNGDGKPDLVSLNGCADQGCVNGGVGVLLGNGDGTFRAAVATPAFGPAQISPGEQLALADFNGDGIPDIASGAIGALLRGKGNGSFQPAVALGAIGPATGVGDLNGDGKPDVAVSGDSDWGVTILLSTVDNTPPLISISATPTTLWPPNGKFVPIVVRGTITDPDSGVRPGSPAFTVIDEYGQIHQSGPIRIGQGGAYSFGILLQASRKGGDRDGRRYTIIVRAADNAGNVGSASTTVTVPHRAP